MRKAVYFAYVALSLIYLAFGDSSIIWGGVNIITQIGFVGFLSHIVQGRDETERLFLLYIKWLSVVNCGYILVCMFITNKFVVIYNTDLFAYVLGIGFVVFLIHNALIPKK